MHGYLLAIAALIAVLSSPGTSQIGWTPESERPTVFGATAFDTARGVLVHAGPKTHERDASGSWRVVDPAGVRATALAYDAARGVCVTFDVAGHTWTWDGLRWTQVATSGPQRRNAYGLVYDSARQRVILYGGNMGLFGELNDTWEWDGAAWTQVATSAPGPAVSSASMAYDVARSEVVLFGGSTGPYLTSFSLDTWTFDGTSWTRQNVTGPSEHEGSMAWDAARSRAVLLTDGGGRVSSEVWEWDGAAWTLRASLAPDRRLLPLPAAAFDPSLPGVRFVNPQIEAIWDGTQFVIDAFPAPPLLSRNAAVYDPVQGVGVLVSLGETWEWDRSRWTQVDAATPDRLANPALVYDRARSQRVLFDFETSRADLDAFEWNGSAWNRVAAAGGVQPLRGTFSATWDPVRQEAMVYRSGGSGLTAPTTWHWNGARWTAYTGPDPGSAVEPRLACDTRRGRVVLWIGDSVMLTAETWEWDGATWTQVATGGPPTRSRPALVYDPVRERTMLFGGRRSSGFVQEIWEWDGRSWRELEGVSYFEVLGAFGYFDEQQGRIVARDDFSTIHRFEYDAVGPSCVRPAAAGAVTPMVTLRDARPSSSGSGTLDATLDGVPAAGGAIVAGLLGFSSPFMPVPLDALGLLGCELQLSSIAASQVLTGSPGSMSFTWSLPVPANPSLRGLRPRIQFAVVDAGANALGLTLSNGVVAVLR